MEGVRWGVAELDDVAALADLFGMHPTDLVRFADVRSFERTARAEPLRNYRYRWMTKSTGGVRLIEAPKPILRHLQRVVLREVVSKIPPHDAAHGFRPGRSVQSCAAPHVGADVVIRMDLESFFTTVPVGRVFRTFRSVGYADEVAHRLTALVTNAVPGFVLRSAPASSPAHSAPHRRASGRLRHPHLPQGAPTSPALANLAAHAMDRRLAGLADRFGSRYTRYADDLAFSGDRVLGRRRDRFTSLVTAIVADEGFIVNTTKTGVAHRWDRQRVAGLVVNERLNVDRRTIDRLRAELHDAACHGPATANRSGHDDYRAHLLGRIGWVAAVNARQGERLRAQFDRIQFPL